MDVLELSLAILAGAQASASLNGLQENALLEADTYNLDTKALRCELTCLHPKYGWNLQRQPTVTGLVRMLELQRVQIRQWQTRTYDVHRVEMVHGQQSSGSRGSRQRLRGEEIRL